MDFPPVRTSASWARVLRLVGVGGIRWDARRVGIVNGGCGRCHNARDPVPCFTSRGERGVVDSSRQRPDRRPSPDATPRRPTGRDDLTVPAIPEHRRHKGVRVTNDGFGPGLGEVFGPNHEGGGPELIQLLTPEGERVEHPEFTFDLDDEAIKGFYRDLVMTRRIDTEATALQRQGELGIWASLLGQEAAQIGSGRAHARPGLRLPDLPRARRRLVPRRRPAPPARTVPRRRPGRLGPARRQVQPLHDRDRRPDPARDRLRDGAAARRRDRHRRPRPRRRRDRLLRRRRDQPGRRQRGLHLGQRLQRAGRVLLPEQPVGDLRADRAADQDPACTNALWASASPACASTATTSSRCTP